ncbi:hypothetical protein RF11_08653 [Thelohanellus kitauei]|uniref:Uncharacterized protein n=1 Tax=Thelohanellus kitauei TaxID=669202 RepID=A0A0C2MY38_THEKT|nr:hypothetical protein RF11_08653 [Thelohanellus kitauei]
MLTYLSRVYLIRYETLNSLHITRSQTVAVNIVVYSQHNNTYGVVLFRLTLKGWRIHCPAKIPPSLMIQEVIYEPSWNAIYIEISIRDLAERIEEKSFIRIENGITKLQPQSQIVFCNLTFNKFQHIDYISYTNEMKVRVSNILALFRLSMTHYRCKIDDQHVILTEYSFQTKVIERCMMGRIGYGYKATTELWESICHSYTSECKRRSYNKFSEFWTQYHLSRI